VHPDIKSHTGGTLSLGKGSVYSTSTRQKLNTKSSTEAELVGIDDVMPLILWTRYFLDAQGYDVQENKVFQDNQSVILLEKNGRRSSIVIGPATSISVISSLRIIFNLRN
jgi:hypothetical protein